MRNEPGLAPLDPLASLSGLARRSLDAYLRADLQNRHEALNETEPISSMVRNLATLGQEQAPERSRLARVLGDVAGLAGHVADAPAPIGRFVRGLPGRAAGGVLSGLGAASAYALEDPNPTAVPSPAQPSVAPTAATVPPRQFGFSPLHYPGQAPTYPGLGADTPAEPQYPGLGTKTDEPYQAPQTGASRLRALRLPDGRVIFTNRDEYGGEEFTTKEGGQLVRAQQRQENPSREALTGMLRASMRATEREASEPPPEGRMVGGEAPETGAGFSAIEGTTQMRNQVGLEDAMGALALARIEQDTARALLTPDALAATNDPNIRAMRWISKNIQPKIDAANAQAAAEKAHILATVPDPKEQARQIDEVEADAAARIDALGVVASSGSRQRLPGT